MQAINGALSSVSICMAYVADVLHPEHRASSFGIILCCYSIGILVGPLGGGYIPPKTASVVSLGGLLLCVLYIILLIPESTSKENRLAVSHHAQLSMWWPSFPAHTWPQSSIHKGGELCT